MMKIEIIIKVIIPILGAIITYLIVPLIKQKTNKEQRENIYTLIKIAVQAAEQMADAGLISIPKKDFVINYLYIKGIDINNEDLNIMIESAVKELKMAGMELKQNK